MRILIAIRLRIGDMLLALSLQVYPRDYSDWLLKAINHEFEIERDASYQRRMKSNGNRL